MNVRQRLAALRVLMKQYRVHGYLVPSTDAHQSEYVPTFWRRREWISGFTGSAGDVLVTEHKAALWTDGRYYLQAADQLSGSGITLMKVGMPETPTMSAWLAKTLHKGQRVAVDPRLLDVTSYNRLRSELTDLGIQLVSVEDNLVDLLWDERPPAPDGTVEVHPVRYAGERFQDKLKRLRKALAVFGARAHVITSLDQIAWLFNIRGSDVLHNPVVIAYAIVTEKSAMLFVDPKKIDGSVRRSFGKTVQVHSYEKFRTFLLRTAKSNGPWWVDPNTTSQWIVDLLASHSKFFFKPSPVIRFRAAKNAVEIRGARHAHLRDGVAMVRFLHWFDAALGGEHITEISLAEKLEEFRKKSRQYRGPSFDTIAGYAAHGAIIHYSATPETDIPLKKRGLLVLDSGGQYADGTTDITRTLCLGPPTRAQKEHFTRVLKGHIQLTLVPFPTGTSGKQLDTLARRALWEVGLDYAHGTGHGVGSYLSVHEGPQAISPTRDTGVALEPGMICSNEPGYYKAGEYGIRTENLVYVAKNPELSRNGKDFFKFETLTLCPIETKLIEPSLLTSQEIRYLNSYHATVRKALTRFLNKKEAAWLAKATRPIR
ncbi:MAG: aminopeptidase P family protein [Calditrichota bacterium]